MAKKRYGTSRQTRVIGTQCSRVPRGTADQDRASISTGGFMAGHGLRVWASLGGLVFVVLAVVGSMLLFDGPSSSSPAKMASYYGNASNRSHMNIGWVLTGLALFTLIW